MDLSKRLQSVLPSGAGVMCDWSVERASNATLYSSDGREFIDFAGGIGVLNTGHCHPKVIAAVRAQLERFTHTAFQLTPYTSYLDFAERLMPLLPISGEKKLQLFSTGAEAVENAVKIARAATKRAGVIAFQGAFHGRTLMTLALTGKVNPYAADFGVMPAGVFHALYPSKTQGVSVAEAVKSVERIFKADIAPHDVAAIVLEPVQGEGGFNPCPPEFMRALREICDRHGIVLIADEVQSGFARTGKLFAMHHFDVEADVITMAKSMAGGFVLSGVAGRASVMDAARKGGLGGTYAGNPLGVAAAQAVLEVFEEEDLCARAASLGERWRLFLEGLDAPEITEVRGLGAMIAVEFGDDEAPNADFASAVQREAMARGLLLLTCGAHGNVVRFLFPLTIPEEQFVRAQAVFAESVRVAREAV